MKRRLFNLAVFASLLLCLACVFMWVRSGVLNDEIRMGTTRGGGVERIISSSKDGLALAFVRASPHLSQELAPPLAKSIFWPPPGHWLAWIMPRYAWFQLGLNQSRGTISHLNLPYPFLSLLTAGLPAIWFWRWRREKKAARGRGFAVETRARAS